MMQFEFLEPQIHDVEIVKYFGHSRAVYEGAQIFPFPLYVLGFSNRCGSNLLAEYLASTGHFALFEEHLNFQTVIDNAEVHGYQSFPDYIQDRIREMSAAGIPGFKANWMQLAMLHRLGIVGMFEGIRVIHLRRENVIDQAISFWIAEQTQQWTSQQASLSEPSYDFAAIMERLVGIDASNDWLRLFCEVFKSDRIEITYEDLEACPENVVGRVCEFSGNELGGWRPPTETISRQRDARNDDFRSRFLADARQSFSLPL